MLFAVKIVHCCKGEPPRTCLYSGRLRGGSFASNRSRTARSPSVSGVRSFSGAVRGGSISLDMNVLSENRQVSCVLYERFRHCSTTVKTPPRGIGGTQKGSEEKRQCRQCCAPPGGRGGVQGCAFLDFRQPRGTLVLGRSNVRPGPADPDEERSRGDPRRDRGP